MELMICSETFIENVKVSSDLDSNGVPLNYTVDDVEEDLDSLERVIG